MYLFKSLIIFCFILSCSMGAYAGLGSGGDDQSSYSNPTGGFGTDNSISGDGAGFNRSGDGFGSYQTMADPSGPPPIPPVDIPLDGGAAILIAIGLGVGGRRIYKKVMNP